MTTDPFIEAARAEGQARIAAMLEVSGASDDIRAWFPAGFEKGAEWARAHLAAQEPTDAERKAAHLAIHQALAADWMSVANALGGSQEQYESLLDSIVCAALSAARAARRDEEKRND